jgi:hypothetical protein
MWSRFAYLFEVSEEEVLRAIILVKWLSAHHESPTSGFHGFGDGAAIEPYLVVLSCAHCPQGEKANSKDYR